MGGIKLSRDPERSRSRVTPVGLEPNISKNSWRCYQQQSLSLITTPCLQKTKQNYFCHYFVKFPPTLIIFGKKMANSLKLATFIFHFT